MIFKISKDKDFFEENPSAGWIEEFKKCSSEEMKYVILVYSYDTPLRTLAAEQRKHRALEYIGLTRMANGKWDKQTDMLITNQVQRVRNAILKLREITRDEDKETLESYDEQLDQFRSLLRKRDKTDKEMDQAMKISKEFPAFLENRKKVQEILEIRDEAASVAQESGVGDGFSTIEDFLG
jgi:predicted RNase H-like nuclease (RuvC/YqgF family)